MFDSAYLKIDRAKHHIGDLQTAISRYSDSARVEFHQDGTAATIRIDRRAENDCSLILGDILHNLRSAFDHAFWELMGIDGGVQDKYTTFPAHRGRQTDYEAACKGIRTPVQDTKDFFIRVGAYPDGAAALLSTLHDLDITDKHSMLNPVFGLAALRDCVIIRPDGSREGWQAIGAPYRRTLLKEDATAIVTPFGPGRFEVNSHTKASLDILFGDIESTVELEPVMPVLDDFVAEVRRILSDMIRMVETRD